MLQGCGNEKDSGGVASDEIDNVAGSKPYNVILISIDTLRPDHLTCYGYPLPTSPCIDEFAKRCTVFTNVHSQSPWTTPSFASMFTSLYPSVLNLGRWPNPGRISANAVTLAEVMRDKGYVTAAFTEGGMVHSKFGFDKGFDTMRERYKRIEFSVPECLDWMNRNKSRNFFVFLHTYDVHRYCPPEQFSNRFMPEYDGDLVPGKELAVSLQCYFDYKGYDDEEDRKRIVSLYDGEILFVDHWLGKLFMALDNAGIMDNTIVILTSDHGEEFWEHGRTGHGYTNYEEVLKVPLMIYHPDMPPGRCIEPARLLDIAPTITDMVGAKANQAWMGTSLVPLIMGETASDNTFSFAEYGHIYYVSVKQGKWKLLRMLRSKKATGKSSEDFLYDLEADPAETVDVSAQHEAMFARMQKLLDTLMKSNLQLSSRYKSTETDLDPELKKQIEGLGYGK